MVKVYIKTDMSDNIFYISRISFTSLNEKFIFRFYGLNNQLIYQIDEEILEKRKAYHYFKEIYDLLKFDDNKSFIYKLKL